MSDRNRRLSIAMFGMTRAQQVATVVGILGLVSAGVIVGAKRSKAPPPPSDSRFFKGSAQQAAQPTVIVVQVAGEVARPGLYRLMEGSCVKDAVTAAGGLTPAADPSALNLAAQLRDGSRLLVPARRPVTLSPTAQSIRSSDRPYAPRALMVNVNVATAEELESLPGIGPRTAQKIVAYRRAHGYFRRPEDLKKVSGIGDKKLARLRPFITVY